MQLTKRDALFCVLQNGYTSVQFRNWWQSSQMLKVERSLKDGSLILSSKDAKDDSAPREKSQKAIQDEIRSVIRQITATVTFLPLLEVSCSFDLLIYTDKDLVVPEKWEESGPQFITNPEEVRLRSFTTTIHKVNSMVAYKIPVND